MGPPTGGLVITVNSPDVIAQVRSAFDAYEAALMRGDVSTLVDLFWRSPVTIRFGDTETSYGFDAITRFRREYMPVDVARTLTRVEVTALGDDVATVFCESRYHESCRTGRQSQTWLRTDEGWRIANAHVSQPATPTRRVQGSDRDEP